MTNTHSLYKSLLPATVGFDHLWSTLDELVDRGSKQTYPPYNIKKVQDNVYGVEVAVAGFKRNELSVEVEDRYLIIKGNQAEEVDKVEYLHKGLAKRNFTLKITLSNDVLVNDATLEDGIMTVFLDRVVPDAKKPRLIEIK